MHTPVLPIRDPAAQQKALDLLENGGVIVAPTDTVYGVMCRFDNLDAVRTLFAVKQRPLSKAIPVLIADLAHLRLITPTPLPPMARTLAQHFWPGPLTLVLPARHGLPDALTAGGKTVGVRMPDHDELRALMRLAGPLAATSANLSGDREACSAEEAQAYLDGLVPLILSDDDTVVRTHHPLPSTVVDLTADPPAVLRPGPIADDVLSVLASSSGVNTHAPC